MHFSKRRIRLSKENAMKMSRAWGQGYRAWSWVGGSPRASLIGTKLTLCLLLS